MREAGFQPKEATRKANYIAYFKQSERIEDFLTAIGAPLAAMEIMNAKLEKNLRGSVNRRVNCDAANLDKAVEAAQVQLEAIRSLEQSGQLEGLPDKLRETARLRLEHPEDTLAELAALCDPPATKSALNHRLRKLVELGQAWGEGRGPAKLSDTTGEIYDLDLLSDRRSRQPVLADPGGQAPAPRCRWRSPS